MKCFSTGHLDRKCARGRHSWLLVALVSAVQTGSEPTNLDSEMGREKGSSSTSQSPSSESVPSRNCWARSAWAGSSSSTLMRPVTFTEWTKLVRSPTRRISFHRARIRSSCWPSSTARRICSKRSLSTMAQQRLLAIENAKRLRRLESHVARYSHIDSSTTSGRFSSGEDDDAARAGAGIVYKERAGWGVLRVS
jgi:hypothetical protein